MPTVYTMGDSSIDEQLLKISLQLFANCPSISSCFHKRLANNGKITTFTWYCSLMPLCTGFLNLENQDLDGHNLRSMLKILYAVCLCLS